MLLLMRFRFDVVRDLLFVFSFYSYVAMMAEGIGVNWGSQATHRLPPDTVVRLLKDNGFAKVKLFDADYDTLNALGGSGIEVMVGIPNDMLSSLARRVGVAEKWVSENVSRHISNDVKISCVAVGNEPFLETYNGSFLNTTYPALQNIQSALIKAGVSRQVKVTVPLNADVYESLSGVPSGGDFRSDIHSLMLSIVGFLNSNAGLFTVNIYPFISLYSDPHFPLDYAFFDTRSSPLTDGVTGTVYYNMFDANYDTLVWSLQKNGFPDLPIVVGEIGWPTDGHPSANLVYAQRFNQGFIARFTEGGTGAPTRRPPLDAYLFSLIDEDAKSIAPGYFERHWGIFTFDGIPKYSVSPPATNSSSLIPAKSVHYLDRKWCVMNPSASLDDPWVEPSVSYACGRADCTSLGFGTSCGNLDARGNISYAFNSYYQIHNQLEHACRFPNISVITDDDPSVNGCRFEIMIKQYVSSSSTYIILYWLLFLSWLCFACFFL